LHGERFVSRKCQKSLARRGLVHHRRPAHLQNRKSTGAKQEEQFQLADKENHRYQVVTIGWEGNRFVHDCPLHFDIINGKIWVQQNMTEWEVGEMLEACGVPKHDIVAGFLPPELREYSNYAVA